jgi:hypothetical protein
MPARVKASRSVKSIHQQTPPEKMGTPNRIYSHGSMREKRYIGLPKDFLLDLANYTTIPRKSNISLEIFYPPVGSHTFIEVKN